LLKKIVDPKYRERARELTKQRKQSPKVRQAKNKEAQQADIKHDQPARLMSPSEVRAAKDYKRPERDPNTRRLNQGARVFNKEDIENTVEHCGRDHSKDKKKAPVEEYSLKVQNRMDAIAARNKGEKVPKKIVPGSPAAKQAQKEVKEQDVMSPRGSTLDKMDARAGLKGTTPSGPIAGSPADQQAKAAAFEKQKVAWANQMKAKQAAVPAQVANQRRPVPQPSIAPTEAPVRTTPVSKSLRT